MRLEHLREALKMPRHDGVPYYHGDSRISSGHATPSQWANEFRYIADLMPDDAPDAIRRRECLRNRAAAIEAGQVRTERHFRVIVPAIRETPAGRATLRNVSYPCSGCSLYSFDEAWILMEVFAAKRGWSDGADMDTYAEGLGQNLTLGILYDGIADPMAEPVESSWKVAMREREAQERKEAARKGARTRERNRRAQCAAV